MPLDSSQPSHARSNQPMIGMPRSPGLSWLAKIVDATMGLSVLDALYQARPANLSPAQFVHHAVERLQLDYGIDSGSLDQVPAEGGTLFIANHPFGAAEGLVLMDLLLRRRPDLKVMANAMLQRLPELAPLIIPIDVFKTGVNSSGLRQALRHLQEGGALLIFPAGEVSRLNFRERAVIDPPWSPTVATLARRQASKIVPIFVSGRPSKTAIAAGVINSSLRTALLPRELIRLRGRRMSLHIGAPMDARELDRLPKSVQPAYLRLVTYSLAADEAKKHALPLRRLQALIGAQDKSALAQDISLLKPEQHLFNNGEFGVYLAQAAQLPHVLPEIGRLRELSFRLVDEGSGLSCDIDDHDAHYQHLFVWHHSKQEIVGAYRLGFTRDILPVRGMTGLYTNSLFDYDPALFEQLGGCVEMGRSFVSPDWQRSFHPLRLLWGGIACVLDQNPDIRWLFGPVSISPSYSLNVRRLMAEALQEHHAVPQLRELIRPRNPLRANQTSGVQKEVTAAIADPALLSRLISRMERGPGLPVLVRQYLELNGRFAGFNVDDTFGGTLDGLVFVEVAGIPARSRRRFGAVATKD